MTSNSPEAKAPNLRFAYWIIMVTAVVGLALHIVNDRARGRVTWDGVLLFSGLILMAVSGLLPERIPRRDARRVVPLGFSFCCVIGAIYFLMRR